MKKLCILLLIVFCLAACGGGGSDEGNSDSDITELALDETATGKITTVGEVDWYRIDAVENDRILTVHLSGTCQYLFVDFMLTIYEKDDDGNLETIFGESAKEEVMAMADITIDVPITGSRTLYLAVRDFKDDEASDLVSYQLSATYSDEVEDNSTFESAIDLTVGPDQVCYADESIFPQSDVDVYNFTIGGDNPSGVYRITAQYVLDSSTTTVPVTLDLELYNEDGQVIQQYKGAKPADHLYVLLPYLDEGDHYLVVGSQGRTSESELAYTLCIEPVDAQEVMENDTSDPADVYTPIMESVTGEDAVQCSLTGSLEYIQDEDWYMIDVTPSMPGVSKNIIINLFHNFDQQVPAELQAQTVAAKYRITVLDETLESIYTYDHSVLATEPNIVEIGAGTGTSNYVMIKPVYEDQMLMAMPYQLGIKLRDHDDPNDSEDPITLTSGVPVTGKISVLGDKDDYEIAVDAATSPKILEVFFSAPFDEAAQVSYAVTVQWDGNTRVIRDTNGVSQGVECKSSFYIPAAETVNIQVSDEQNNDGDDVEYTLLVREVDIPTNLSGVSHPSQLDSSPVYHNEISENTDASAPEITVIEYDKEIHPSYKADTTMLRVGPLVGNAWTSEWIAGYVDYDGDRDLFELNFDDITHGVETWYFDIQIQMVAPGSEVEYSWTLFRDAAPANDVLVERMYLENVGTAFEFEHFPEGGGIIASWADTDHEETTATIDVTIPDDAPDDPEDETDTLFWIGKDSVGSKFYFSVNDFNRAVLSRTWDEQNETWIPTPNPIPDNDWGYSPSVGPYYFQVTVTYHDDRGCPEPYECDN
ncbi:MAG: hypothetical protein PVG41_07455 [Desulfobacteraceae bacterium]|jgi:hypothetical protein